MTAQWSAAGLVLRAEQQIEQPVAGTAADAELESEVPRHRMAMSGSWAARWGHIAEDGPGLGELDWPNALEGATGNLAVEQADIDEVGDIDPEESADVERGPFDVDTLEAPGSWVVAPADTVEREEIAGLDPGNNAPETAVEGGLAEAPDNRCRADCSPS